MADFTRNIVLIGMPGVGKSSAGVILAKQLNMNFIDTDIYIQQQTGQSLHNLIASSGLKAFCDLEADLITKLNVNNHVIATGGSVVYDNNVMQHLKKWYGFMAGPALFTTGRAFGRFRCTGCGYGTQTVFGTII